MQRPVLGKGLEALIPELKKGIEEIEIDKVRANRYQPRISFSPDKMEELVASIKEKGVVQPIIVRPSEGGYELVAGARRLKAATDAGLKRIPAIIRELKDEEMLEIAIIENIQREELNPIEEAKAYQELITRFGLTHLEIGTRVGKDRTSITNAIRLLQLPHEIQEWVKEGKISSGHAKALLGLDPMTQIKVAKEIIDKGLSVRKAEALIRLRKRKAGVRQLKRDPLIKACEEELMGIFGTKVMIQHGRRKGRIIIEYYSLEDLERIIEGIRR